MDTRSILEQLEQAGIRCSLFPWKHVAEVQRTMDGFREEGSLSAAVYDYMMNYVEYAPPVELPGAVSVLVVSTRDVPHLRTAFEYGGQRIPTVIPSAYLPAVPSRQVVADTVTRILAEHGYQAVRAALPFKTLAVRSGLARYGRNNITYVPGFGSFHRLAAFHTDLPCEADPWGEPHLLEGCTNCQACRKRCPSGAISGERVLIRADRCVSFYNEMGLEVKFPDYFEPDFHTCLAGCLECQKICPEDHEFLNYVDGVEFNEAETALFLQGVAMDALPEGTRGKIAKNQMENVYEVLPRNLAALIGS